MPRYKDISHLFLLLSLLCVSCTSNINSSVSLLKHDSLNLLPAQLKIKPLSFDTILNAYDGLDDKQKVIAIKYLLAQNNISDEHRAELAYMLARLTQTTDPKEALSLFDIAQTYPPLTIKSLWHKNEAAAMLGKEKLVRQSLTALIAQVKDRPSLAAAQYAMAQSYIRASETANASKLFNQIRSDFPETNYAIGAGYYLGTIAYNQFAQQNQHNLSPSATLPLKEACAWYCQYLQASPAGHFSPDILLKLENLASRNLWHAKENELILMAKAYSANSQYKLSWAYWQKAGVEKHLLAAASCLVALQQFRAAEEKFFKGLNSYAHTPECLTVANEISSHLNASDCLTFWQQLHRSKFAFQDIVLWNIAIRQSPTEALRYFQDLITHYPQSIRAPEAQWWLLWHKFKSTPNKSLSTIPELFYKATIKYNHCHLTPRFLFWAGKIAEKINDKQRAILYYQQALQISSLTYYGQRANARLNVINNIAADDGFHIAHCPANIPVTNHDQIKGAIPAALIWDCPPPDKAIGAAQQKGLLTLCELIHIKQYAEALSENDNGSPEITAWLEGKCGQPWLAINTATQCLENKSSLVFEPILLRQYSFPLLYNSQILANCKTAANVNPFLMHALVREESRYNPNAISQAHALGLCQLMPATANSVAQNIGIKLANKEQLFQADLNLALGTAYLASILKTFGNDGLPSISSYNAGINAVKHFLINRQKSLTADPDQFVEDFPFHETRDYLRKVFTSYWHYKQIYRY